MVSGYCTLALVPVLASIENIAFWEFFVGGDSPPGSSPLAYMYSLADRGLAPGPGHPFLVTCYH